MSGVNGRSATYQDTRNPFRFVGQLRDGETPLDYFLDSLLCITRPNKGDFQVPMSRYII